VQVVGWCMGFLFIVGLGLVTAAIMANSGKAGAPEELWSGDSVRAWINILNRSGGLSFIFLPLCWVIVVVLYREWRWYRTKGLRLLGDIRDEVASGQYDGEEIARRLREYEKKGICVQSFTYALLRLGSSSLSAGSGLPS